MCALLPYIGSTTTSLLDMRAAPQYAPPAVVISM
jgi:hypothetical protein